jgi:glutathione S-transferase
MKLVGQLDSPFVRRAAVSLLHYGMEFDLVSLSVFDDFDEILSMNPLGRVPFLILDSGEVILNSQSIIEFGEATADRRLLPRDEPHRSMVQRIDDVAVGLMEKSVELRTETVHKITEARDVAWKKRLERQIDSCLTWLERLEPSQWFYADQMTRADVSVAIGFTNLAHKFPALVPAGRYPRLAQHCKNAEALPLFSAAAFPGSR